MLKKRKKNPAYRGRAFWVIGLLVIAVITLGWLVWRGKYPPSPRFNFILIRINHESQKILSGEPLALHPNDKLKILKVSTNIPFNLGVRLVAKGLDVDALRYEEMSLSGLLPNQEIFEHYRFQIRIKYRNRDLGYMDWEVQPYAEDWLDKADRIINGDQRLAILERAIDLMPGDERLKRRILEEYKSLKRWKQAAAILQEMAGKNPDRETLNELLKLYTAMQSKDRIISVLKRLVDQDPEDLEARGQLAEVLEQRGKRKAAIKEYEAILKRLDKRDRLPVYKRLGYLYTKTGKHKKAISFYLKAVDLDKKDANLYYNLSYLYEKIHQKDKADVYLSKAARLKSGDVESRLKLAHGLINKGKLKKAEKYISEILKKKPGSLEALLLMAQVVEKRGKDQELRRIYKKILSLNPENETVIYNLGALEYEAGDLKASLHNFKRYIKLNPKDTAVHGIIFDIYKKQKNAKDAFEEAQILVKLSPKEIDPYHYMFDYLNGQGDYEKIIRVMEKGLKANPGLTDLREYMVLAYLKTGKEDLAIKQMEEILKVRPKDIDLLLQLARLREKRGEFPEALEAYKGIIDKTPDHEEAEEAYLRLRLRGVRGEEAR